MFSMKIVVFVWAAWTTLVHAEDEKIRRRTEVNKRLISFPLLPHAKVLERKPEVRRLLETQEYRMAAEERRQNGRLHRSLGDGKEVDALYQGYGTHYVDLWVGTPPQRQTVIVDTGSGVAAWPCSQCVECGDKYHTDGYFNEKASHTFNAVECGEECMLGECFGGEVCELSMEYAEGSSWSAYEAVDDVYVGGLHSNAVQGMNTFSLHFGCQIRLTGLFNTQLADGILGMDYSPESLWSQMRHQNALSSSRFSLCYSHQRAATRQGTQAGAMTLGGTDARLHNRPMVFMHSSIANGSFYSVQLRAMFLRVGGGSSAISDSPHAKVVQVKVDGNVLNNNDRVIVDSGTTNTYLSKDLQLPFAMAWMQAIGTEFSRQQKNYHLTDADIMALPTVLIQVTAAKDSNNNPRGGVVGELNPKRPGDVLWAIPPTSYMEYIPEEEVHVCRLVFNEAKGGILGANAMMGHDIMFDVDNSRIGISESDCNYESVDGEEDSNR